MDMSLARVLIDKNVLKENMEVTATYMGLDISGVSKVKSEGEFFIKSFILSGDKLVFTLTSTRDGITRKINCDAVTKIEGMEPSRYAQVYNIKPDGSSSSTKKKRGRKTNAEKAARAAALNG